MALHASGEDYLEAILVLHKKMGMVRSVDVARHMEVSKPSVCHAVTTLKKGGFLTMDEDFSLHLTDIGREVAEQTYEKHCFFTRQLIKNPIVITPAIIWFSVILDANIPKEIYDIASNKNPSIVAKAVVICGTP